MKTKLPFLATTALREFWDENSDIIMLGKWCDPFDTTYFPTMPYLWKKQASIGSAILKCSEYYDFCLDILTSELNTYHQLNNSKHYYKILFGEWLYHYVNVQYDRFMSIYLFYKTYGNFDTILLDRSQFYKPLNFIDFIHSAQKDEYNLQIYSNVIEFLFKNKHFQAKSLKLNLQHTQITKRESLKSSLLRHLSKLLSLFHTQKIIICEPYFPKRSFISIIKLLFKSRFRLIIDNMYHFNYKDINTNFIEHNPIKIKTNNRFKQYIAHTILDDIPSLYFENFQIIRNFTLNHYKYKSKIFYTAFGLYGNIEAKIYLAENYHKIKIFSHQHGGLYGWSSSLWGEEYERSISNFFLTSGWKENNQTIPIGLPFLHGFKHNFTILNQITYITTASPKYLLRFQYYPTSSYYLEQHYLLMQYFFQNLSPILLNQSFLIRTYHSNESIKMTKKLINTNNYSIQFDSTSSMLKLLEQSKLLIFDHFGTTMIESLYLNKPTIIFFDHNIFKFRTDFQEILQQLIKVKIVHTNAKDAAIHVNSIANDIGQWWNSIEVQEVRGKFTQNYAKCYPDWDTKLINLFNQII